MRRWVPVGTFTAGEPDPHPPGAAVVRRRLRAVHRDPDRARTHPRAGSNALLLVRSGYRRYSRSVVGHVWVRRSALRWRRLAWTAWTVVALAVLGESLLPAPRPAALGVVAEVTAVARSRSPPWSSPRCGSARSSTPTRAASRCGSKWGTGGDAGVSGGTGTLAG